MTPGLGKGIWCHLWLNSFSMLAIVRSDIRLHVKWAVNLVIANGIMAITEHTVSRTLLHSGTLGVDKVSMLTHTYPHNPWGRLKLPYGITRLTAHFMCGLMSDLVICKFKKYGHTWHRKSLLRPGVVKPHKPKPFILVHSKTGNFVWNVLFPLHIKQFYLLIETWRKHGTRLVLFLITWVIEPKKWIICKMYNTPCTCVLFRYWTGLVHVWRRKRRICQCRKLWMSSNKEQCNSNGKNSRWVSQDILNRKVYMIQECNEFDQ